MKFCKLQFSIYQISKEAPLGNVKEYVLDRRCQIGDIVTYLSQVASALHYLHVNHIVHGDLSAEYVNVLAPDKVHDKKWHENNHHLGCPQNTSCKVRHAGHDK